MASGTPDFTLQVDGVRGACAAAEAWAEQRMRGGQIPVLSCESACIRGDIARRAANLVAGQPPFARACYAETMLVPYSAMGRWVRDAAKVVMIDGCFLRCVGRMLPNAVDRQKIIFIDALKYYRKYSDVFYMEDVPEADRDVTAREVAAQLLPLLNSLGVTTAANKPASPPAGAPAAGC